MTAYPSHGRVLFLGWEILFLLLLMQIWGGDGNAARLFSVTACIHSRGFASISLVTTSFI